MYSPGIPIGSAEFTLLPQGIGTHSFTVSSPWGQCSTFSAAEASHSANFHSSLYPYWVVRDGVNSAPKAVYATPELRASNPSQCDLGSNALTIRLRAHKHVVKAGSNSSGL